MIAIPPRGIVFFAGLFEIFCAAKLGHALE